MGANPNSYLPAQLAAVFEVNAERHDMALRVDAASGPVRFRLRVSDARELSRRLVEELEAYDARLVQSPISSGMPSSDGSPIEGQSV